LLVVQTLLSKFMNMEILHPISQIHKTFLQEIYDNLGIPKMEQRCERTSVENLPCHCHAKVGVTDSTLIMSKISRL
jgi:hypothetical protein